MSGGQQQRVAIARAVVGDRRLILADEPTGALDTETGEEILRLLRARCDAGAAGVLVTHEARHAAWADRVVFLRDGVDRRRDRRRPGRGAGRRRRRRDELPLAAWRLPLRIARRDALRHRARSRPRAGDDRAAGARGHRRRRADPDLRACPASSRSTGGSGRPQALVDVSQRRRTDVQQPPDPDDVLRSRGRRRRRTPAADGRAGRVAARRGAARSSCGTARPRSGPTKGQTPVEVTEVDLARPAHRRALRPQLGPAAARTPARSWSTRSLARQGLRTSATRWSSTADDAPADPIDRRRRRVDDDPRLPGRRRPARRLRRSTTEQRPRSGWSTAARSPGQTVRELNAIGATVASRAVIDDPPPALGVAGGGPAGYGGTDDDRRRARC